MTLRVDCEVPNNERVFFATLRGIRLFVAPSGEDIPHHVHRTCSVRNHISEHLCVVDEYGDLFSVSDLQNNESEKNRVLGELMVLCRIKAETFADAYLPKTSLPLLFNYHRCLIDEKEKVFISFFIEKLLRFEYKDK